MVLRTLLAWILVVGGLAACGGDDTTPATESPATSSTTTTESQVSASSTTGAATTTTTTEAEPAGLALDSDGMFAVAALEILASAVTSCRDLADAFISGALSDDEMDLAVHDLYGEVGRARSAAWQLDWIYFPEEAPALGTAAVAAVALAEDLDSAVFFWDETYDNPDSATGPDEILALLDTAGGPFLAARTTAMEELLALGVDQELLASIQGDPDVILADYLDERGDDLSNSLVFGDWAWRMSENALYGEDQILHVAGSLTNTGDEPFDIVEFDVELLDGDGTVIDVSWGLIDQIVIYPGETHLIRASGWNDSYFVRHFEDIAAVRHTPPTGQVYTGYSGYRHDFTFTVDGTEEWGGDNIDYDGKVTNTGDLAQEEIRIIGIAYDASGAVVGWGDGGTGDRNAAGEWTWESSRRLEPGATSGYKITIGLWWPATVARVEIIAEGTDGTF